MGMNALRLVITVICLTLALPAAAQEGASEAGGTKGMQAKFQSWDSNADGQLTPEEWQGPQQRFKILDKNEDGLVSLEEFTALKPDAGHAKAPPSCDKCQEDWRQCMVGKPGFIKQNCDIPLKQCTSRCQ